jgi:hypothetical protein
MLLVLVDDRSDIDGPLQPTFSALNHVFLSKVQRWQS